MAAWPFSLTMIESARIYLPCYLVAGQRAALNPALEAPNVFMRASFRSAGLKCLACCSMSNVRAVPLCLRPVNAHMQQRSYSEMASRLTLSIGSPRAYGQKTDATLDLLITS